MLQLLDCGLTDEQAEALANAGRTAHSTNRLTTEDVNALMQLRLTEQQKKKVAQLLAGSTGSDSPFHRKFKQTAAEKLAQIVREAEIPPIS